MRQKQVLNERNGIAQEDRRRFSTREKYFPN